MQNADVARLIDNWEEKGFDAVVLRGHAGLPRDYGGDLDVVVRPKHFQDFVDETFQYVARNRFHLFRYVGRPHVYALRYYRKLGGVTERLFIDVQPFPGSWLGFQYLTSEEIIEARRKNDRWWAPSPLHDVVLKVFPQMLIGSQPPTKYLPELRHELPKVKEAFLQFVDERFALVSSSELYDSLIVRDTNSLARVIPKLKLGLVIRSRPSLPKIRVALSSVLAETYHYVASNGMAARVVCDCSNKLSAARQSNLTIQLSKEIGHVFKHVLSADEVRLSSSGVLVPLIRNLKIGLLLLRDRLVIDWQCPAAGRRISRRSLGLTNLSFVCTACSEDLLREPGSIAFDRERRGWAASLASALYVALDCRARSRSESLLRAWRVPTPQRRQRKLSDA